MAEVEFYRAVYGMEPAAVDKELGRPRARLDVAFLGESVVEAMDGRWLGKKVVSLGGVSPGPDGVRVEGKRGEDEEEGEIKKKRTKSIDQIFEHFFRKDKGGYFEGCALGIAGDTVSEDWCICVFGLFSVFSCDSRKRFFIISSEPYLPTCQKYLQLLN